MFDIHDYGDRIVGALSGVGHRRQFSSIVHDLDNFEACKYLLASLQLVKNTSGGFQSESSDVETEGKIERIVFSLDPGQNKF